MPGIYSYQGLNAVLQEIRLLEVMPGNDTDPIEVGIHHTPIKAADRPLYETISYVWGDSTRSARVAVCPDGLHLSVPASTEIALKKVRQPDRVRTVWIDAASINQDDLIERGQQVAMMGEIYASSSGNLVCLGDSSNDSMPHRMKRVVDALLENAAEETDELRRFGPTVKDTRTGGWIYSTLEPSIEVDLPALQHLLEHPWFKRLWVVQEAALAPKSTVLLNTVHIDLLKISRAIVWWNHKKANSALNSEFLSVLREETNKALIPDYTKPLREVLKTATRHMIAEAGDLWILRSITHHIGDLELAKVPSWAARSDRVGARGDEAEFPNLFKSSKGLDKISVGDGNDSDVLNIHGVTVDKIASVTTIFSYSEHHRFHEFTHWLRSALELCLEGRRHQVPAQVIRALATTLAIECSSNGLRAGEGELRPLEELLEELLRNNPGQSKEREIELCRIANLTCDIRHTFDRRLLVTNTGRCGLGPSIMQSGDVVTIVRGADVPFVLRPADKGYYQFVGAAYVNGIMDGEAVEEHRSTGAIQETFAMV
ncbi:hypothetical protein LTR56_010612 [Elasticomyces elasticus]|nr:hypothetical protein LTR56_010612 [Elasticomyces elasticus]KAK3648649.1 hypothetical protein LTR22_013285 [Elasticomyces elasticus]KAK4932468.1 hypothetical protein LTR49_001337 [Elasticomyces elasticus]KAK5760169.1 hypothetical protein LTS12_009724 [Elasticomyces elasticus]